MKTLQEVYNSLPTEGQTLLLTEIKKYANLFDKDIKKLTPAEIASLLTELSTETQKLSVKTIQLEAQLKEKESELNTRITQILEKYAIQDISGLEEKKASLETELQGKIDELKALLNG